MGYSIAIRSRSESLRNQMLVFLGANYRPWGDVSDSPLDQKRFNSAGMPSEDLSYDTSAPKLILGFDYQSGLHGWEREYVYAVLRWMSLKVGKQRSRFAGGRTAQPVHYIIYDGYEAWPVIIAENAKQLRAIPAALRWSAVDKLGMRTDPDKLLDLGEQALFDMDPAIYKRAMKDVTQQLGAGPDNKDHASFLAWRKKYKAICLKHAKPEVDRVLGLIRGELARLDVLWAVTGS